MSAGTPDEPYERGDLVVPADLDRDPEPEVQLRSVSSGASVNAAYGFGAGGVVVLCGASLMLHRRLV